MSQQAQSLYNDRVPSVIEPQMSVPPGPEAGEPYSIALNRAGYLFSASRQSSSMTLGGPSTVSETMNHHDGQPNGVSLSTWAAQVSSSLATLGEQISTISHVVPSDQIILRDAESVVARIEALEARHIHLEEEVAQIRRMIEQLHPHQDVGTGKQPEGGRKEDIDETQKKVDNILATIQLEQSRLYPRLLNSTASMSKMSIQPLPTASGKPPPNFPATKGEYEHLTKERYEDIMKAYGLPIKGDTTAKKDALRAFLGLPA
ncbi:hypothetical protein EYR40_009984 [Pleurotus pulmonarius]|nr:hypothetical protein EYR36_010622 [Pleurotus pulmonarius]KAF4588433.1 hypothetical protein EYR40_009984 [Pleurotus pulmonarius]KAF4590530.1 hypothetical protein EYR38_009831 [Pleurotus pulmonarius]